MIICGITYTKKTYITDEQKDYILSNCYDKTTSEIAEDIGLSTDKVRKVLIQNNKSYKKSKIYREITKEEELWICELYKQYGSLYKVSKETGRHKLTIKKIVTKYGYTINKPSNIHCRRSINRK